MKEEERKNLIYNFLIKIFAIFLQYFCNKKYEYKQLRVFNQTEKIANRKKESRDKNRAYKKYKKI